MGMAELAEENGRLCAWAAKVVRLVAQTEDDAELRELLEVQCGRAMRIRGVAQLVSRDLDCP